MSAWPKIKVYDWVPENDAVFVVNGVEHIVRLDGTNKQVRYEVKKPKMIICHTGPTPYLKQLQSENSNE